MAFRHMCHHESGLCPGVGGLADPLLFRAGRAIDTTIPDLRCIDRLFDREVIG